MRVTEFKMMGDVNDEDALVKMANGMRALARERDGELIRHELPNGLHFVLKLRHGAWFLSFFREHEPPSRTELREIYRDFEIPRGAQITSFTYEQWRGFRVTWGTRATSGTLADPKDFCR